MPEFPQPHCNSYYAATANNSPDYPPLRGADSCDVCIVGAGFTGISTALDLIGIVLNRVPHVGRLDDNIFYSQGYSGHGVNVTHLAGQVVADAIAGTYERFDVFEKVKHFRIPAGQWVGNQLLALGMIYFRLLDLL